MPFVSIRITTTDASGSRPPFRIINLLKALKRHLVKKYYTDPNLQLISTAGLEELNKYGEPCPQHIHFNFEYEPIDLLNPKRCLVSWLRNHAQKSGYELRGNAMWCVQFFPDPESFEDELRFWRYPLKERGIAALTHWEHPDYSLSVMSLLARDERQRAITSNCLAREKSRDKVTFKDKLFTFLNDQTWEPSDRDHETVWTTILEYYRSQDKPINYQTIEGYTILYQLAIGDLTPSQAYKLRSKMLQ